MRIVIAPDSFKGTLSAAEACAAIAAGLRRALDDVDIVEIPLADGGEGTACALVTSTDGRWVERSVHGPLSHPVTARFGLLGDGAAAIVEMAAASGLTLVPESRRDILAASTFGTGELLRAAFDTGAARVLVAIGGSATCDGGCGMAQALGVRFLDQSGRPLPDGIGGGQLGRIHTIDMSKLVTTARQTAVEVLCDVRNPLNGPDGAARVYGPQKGAGPADVDLLDEGLRHFADVVHRELGVRVGALPGAGAAGGLGAGLAAFLSARLSPGAPTVMHYVDFDARCRSADAIITGEGRLDAQSLAGKVVSTVADAGHRLACPVYVIAGQVDLPADDRRGFAGVAAVSSPTAARVNAPAATAAPADALANCAADCGTRWFVRE